MTAAQGAFRRTACLAPRRPPRARLLALALGAALAAALPRGAPALDLATAARKLVGAGQGVRVETEDGRVLVSQAGERAVHPASVSKLPTTLALLRKLGPLHRFETRFAASGPLRDGLLEGNLVVEGAGDPYLVDENALLVLLALRNLGVERVSGDLVVHGPLLFDWTREAASERLRRAFEGDVPRRAWRAVRRAARLRGKRPPALSFERAAPAHDGAGRVLVTHRSQALLPLMKTLNGHSNNVFALLADQAGGIGAVQALARKSVPPRLREEIVLGDGAGADPRNRLSPRASVALLRVLAAELARSDKSLADVLPVAGVDAGTLQERFAGPTERGRVVGKTGTYGDYGASALVGALRSRERGVVYFAILNHGVPVETARGRQDAFVRALLEAFETEPWPYERDGTPAFSRVEVELAPAP